MEYYYTVERVTLEERAKEATTRVREKLSSMGGYLWQQLRLCVKSSQWNILMLYMIIYNLFNFLSSYSIFYYCNWVLGTYNDGITQALFYGLGNAPLGLGIFLFYFSQYHHITSQILLQINFTGNNIKFS